MAIRVEHSPGEVVVTLSAFDRLAGGRHRLRIPVEQITRANAASRGDLEELIDHRVVGIGSHNAQRRPGRRRVGMMLGREVVGNQFWAVTAGPPEQRLLVLELAPAVQSFVRAVLECDDPRSIVARMAG